MKRFISIATLVFSLFSVCAFGYGYEESYDVEYYSRFKDDNISINVYNWGEYISDGSEGNLNVNKEFEKLTGIKVIYTQFSTNEELYSKLKMNSVSYDVIIPSDYMIGKMIKEDMLLPLNFDNIPNFKYINDTFKNPSYDPNNLYSVPYTWGTVGLIYNKKMVGDDVIDSWDCLWDEKYTKNILMFNNPRDAFGIAELKLGYSLNTEDKNEIMEAAEQLKIQKPIVQAHLMDQIFDKMQGEEAAIAPYYAGDALTMIEVNPNLAFTIPKEGTNIFTDAAVIPKNSTHKEAAEMYINFLNEPNIAAENIEYIRYSTPNDAAKELLPDEIKNNKIVYPDQETLDKTEFFNSLSNETNALMDKQWVDILSFNQYYSKWTMPVFIIGGLIFSGVMIYYKKRKIKKRMQQ